MKDRIYCCIDLKSFFASVECVARGLDPFTTNLVVADPARTDKSVCLAITPAMKMLGIKNRCRVFEIPKSVKYIMAKPRMKLYMDKSAEIYGIYLNYISPDDIHVYSIDECFIDLTDYTKLYKMTAKELAKMLIDKVYEITGIRATVGIGTNLFLTKIALDITAKHADDFMGYLDEETFKKTLWYHRPITDFWNIGEGTAKRLYKLGLYDLYDVAHFNEDILYKEFGINAELLIDHANGIEPCLISDIKNYKTKSFSLSNSQILFSDYTFERAKTILKEMVYALGLELVEKGLVCEGIMLGANYSNKITERKLKGGGSRKLPIFTDSINKLIGEFIRLYDETVDKNMPIRRIEVCFMNVADKVYKTYDLFTNYELDKKESSLNKTLVGIKNKYGKNALLKGISYCEEGTARARNKMIGGHNGGEDE